MKLRNRSREPGFYKESLYASYRNVVSAQKNHKPKDMNKSKQNKKATKKTIKSKPKKAEKSKVTKKATSKMIQSELNSDFENFKNNFQYEIIKSLSTAGLATKRGSFTISTEMANELRTKYRINCRFSPENSEK
jgi:hypothetical protein